MSPSNPLEERAAEVLKEIAALGPMRKGSLCKRVLKRKTGKGEMRTRGPYWYYTFKEKGKSVSKMIKDSEAELYEEQIENFRQFQELTREYAALSQRIADRQAQPSEGKKNSRA